MNPAIIALVVICLSSLPVMLTLFLYSNFYRVAIGDTRKQIELNSDLLHKFMMEEKTSWSKLMSHVPDLDNREYEIYTCKEGCCHYFVEKNEKK